MKTTAKRPRTDTVKAAVQASQNAAQPPIDPPACVSLRPGDRPFWERVITSKARDNWTAVDLVSAAQLARAQADIEALQVVVDTEGYIVDGKINPAAQMLETLVKRSAALTRLLQVHAIATVGRSTDTGDAARLERQARQQADDELIPRLRIAK